MATPTKEPAGTLRQEWRCKCGTQLVAVWEVKPTEGKAGEADNVRCPTCGEPKSIPGRVLSCAHHDGEGWKPFPVKG